MALAGPWIEDSIGDKGVGPVDSSTGNGKAWRAYNISGDYADSGVVVVGSAGANTFSNAAALADGLANPTVGGVGAFGHLYNGATWDRMRGISGIDGFNPAGVPAASLAMWDGALSVWRKSWAATEDAAGGNRALFVVGGVYNGATFDRMRGGAFTASTTPTGVLNTLGLSIYNTTVPSYTNGQFGTPQMGSRGSIHAELWASDAALPINYVSGPLADALANSIGSTALLDTVARGWGFNGTTWDRLRAGNQEGAGTTATGALYVLPAMLARTQSLTRSLSAADADGQSRETTLSTNPALWNGATMDRQRNNTEGTLLASAARTAETGSADQTNYNARGVIVFLNISAASGTGGLSVRIQGKDPVSGAFYFIDTNATPQTGTGRWAFEVYPGASTAGAGSSGGYGFRVAASLPRTWRALVQVGDASSYTYSLAYALTV